VLQPLQQRTLELLHLLELHHLPALLCNLASVHAGSAAAAAAAGAAEGGGAAAAGAAAAAEDKEEQHNLKGDSHNWLLLIDGAATQAALLCAESSAGPTTLLREELLRRVPEVGKSWEGLGKLLHLQHKYRSVQQQHQHKQQQQQQHISSRRVRCPQLLQASLAAAEEQLGCMYTPTQLPLVALTLALLAPDDVALVGCLLLSRQLTAALPSLPCSSICNWAYAAALCLFQMMREEGVEKTLRQQQLLLRQLDTAVLLLSRVQQRLSLQQRETLKEICFFLCCLTGADADSAVAAAAAKTAAAAAAISAETRAFAAAATLAQPEGPLPLGPPSLDYTLLEVKPVLSRKLLVAEEATGEVALHHVGVREVYVHLQQQQQQQQQQREQQQRSHRELAEVLPGILLLDKGPQLTAAESFSLACITSFSAAASPQLQHRLVAVG
ncbi:hypothetical protein, conserved, partial [Eimeria acervulina]